MKKLRLLVVAIVLALLAAACGVGSNDDLVAVAAGEPADDGDEQGGISSPESAEVDGAFDLLSTVVRAEGDEVVFQSDVVGSAGSAIPEAVGALDQAPVWSYVWPTTLDSSAGGFDADQGILALAATSHPDFDDTPLYDEDGDGDKTNDGADWHAHWVVLVDAADCGGGLSVRGIPDGETPTVPLTWPELPILIDSPDIATALSGQSVEIRVPRSEIGGSTDFNFDGVTAGLRISTSPHDPLLCVNAVFDVASGDLSLPGEVER